MFKAIVFFMVILVSCSYAAEISGKVYDFDLNIAKNAVVEINTIPIQRYVAKDGSYSFQVGEGKYTITAKFNGYSDMAELEVKGDGIYKYDFILFPSTDDTLPEDEDIDINIFDEGGNKKVYLYSLLAVFFILFLIVYFKRDFLLKLIKTKKTSNDKETEKDDLSQVISIIKENNGRIVQKDLREKLNLSEAKVSLMVTELEHKRLVGRIKKGRGNVIILK